jgi:hypothetical protein
MMETNHLVKIVPLQVLETANVTHEKIAPVIHQLTPKAAGLEVEPDHRKL